MILISILVTCWTFWWLATMAFNNSFNGFQITRTNYKTQINFYILAVCNVLKTKNIHAADMVKSMMIDD